MKIGFSFGRCLRDIVLGKVKIDDVLLIVGRTCMPDEDGCKWVIGQYMARRGYLGGLDEARCMEVGLELYRSRRIIEPRSVGAHAFQAPAECVWMDLFPTTVDDTPNESVTAAWEHYRMLIGLTSQLPEVDEEALKHRKSQQAEAPASAPKKRGRKSKADKQAEAERKKVIDLLSALIV
jgi:hypothetical protein